jgi:hypothetical protein
VAHLSTIGPEFVVTDEEPHNLCAYLRIHQTLRNRMKGENMFASQFSRLPVIVTRMVIVVALLPWMSGIQNDSQRQPVLADPMRGLPPGWTASEWSEVVRTVRADLLGSTPHAPLADPWTQKANVIAEDAEHMVSFGWSVAVDGDTLVVGAPNGRVWDDDRGQYFYSGTAYVFEKSTSGWSHVHQVAKLYPEDYIHCHSFGWSVAIDGNFIVVGAPDAHKPYAGTPGAAYLFMETAEGWKQIKKLTELSPAEGDAPRFGLSVDIDGDLIVIGAPMEDLFYDGFWHNEQGSAYIFQIPVGNWPGSEAHENGFLRPSDGRPGDSFGASVAVSGHTVIASAYAHEPDPNNPDEIAYGKAYIFTQSDPWGNANDAARFTASDAADHEYFGWSVAIDGDLAAVGAPGESSFDENGEESVYLFKRPVGGWSGSYTETARLVASDDNMFHDFGNSVAVSGGVVVIGAPWWDTIGSYSKTGAVYVFTEPAGGWVDMMTENQRLLADDHEVGDEFGYNVAIDGTAIAVGVPKNNGNFGSAYVFDSAPVQLDSVSITEPVMCGVNTGCLFSATVSPLEASQPITYVWQATGQSVVTHTGRGLTDSINLTWNMTGTQAITVTATNVLTRVNDSHLINVIRLYYTYLPLVLR